MKLHFTGDISTLTAGISLLAPELGIETATDGYTVRVAKADTPTLTVTFGMTEGEITYCERCQFFRALGLAVEQMRAGNDVFSITEKPQFETIGTLFDVAQGNAAPNLTTAKDFLRLLALMGHNMMMLYCEDCVKVDNYPYFGYMRPTYTEAELRELDDYADALGIEMIPCIQTLAHLTDGLRWRCFHGIRDYESCLLVGKQETYDFIRNLLASASRPFRSRRIHIGMDEAWKLGRGKYLDLNGHRPTHEIMTEHLARVMEIINELGLEPMMWDDMFFTAGTGNYYDPDFVLPQEMIDAVPHGMRCVYWDYYTEEREHYEKMIPKHKQLDPDMIFAGGIWTWRGFGLNWQRTLTTTESALSVCKAQGVKHVFMTTWGDNATECLLNTTLVGCQLFAEYAYADVLDYEKLRTRFAFCTGGNLADFEQIERFDLNPLVDPNNNVSGHNPSKYLMWQDVLTGLFDKNIEGLPMDAHYAALAKDLEKAIGRNGRFDGMFRFNHLAARVLEIKCEMGLRLTAAYRAGDKNALRRFADEELPELLARSEALQEEHRRNWFALYKPFGWDVMDMRHGSLQARIKSAISEIKAYLDGTLERIEELEVERLYYNVSGGPVTTNNYGNVVSPSRIDYKVI